MPTIAYIANEFPNAVEWYVADEIRELRRRGATVLPCSAVRVPSWSVPDGERDLASETLSLRPLSIHEIVRAVALCACKFHSIVDLLRRATWEGHEPLGRRVRALAHTVLGAAYAKRLERSGVDHIHAHHGYYSAWIAMVAARLLRVPFSLTLHGSDLLVDGRYLDTKLEQCSFCRTISEFNRQYVLQHFSCALAEKIVVERLGVDVPAATLAEVRDPENPPPLTLLAVGRLCPVKNHQFLVRACYLLRELGVEIRCWIVGDGPERKALEFLINELRLQQTVTLVGAVPREEVGRFYDAADLVVLTSRSEGIPLVLMEAMARARIVPAPAITGIPELVIDGKTGFLYQPDDLEGFVWRVDQIGRSLRALSSVRRAARTHVRMQFERKKNLESFAKVLMERVRASQAMVGDENPVLQQI